MSDFTPILDQLALGQKLDVRAARKAFDLIMDGKIDNAQIGAFLMGLRITGESTLVITEGARALRSRLSPVTAPEGAIDTCGTGGDAKGTYNISTAAALIVAGAGICVAKHGNKALSSKSGSAEVLEELGVHMQISPAQVEACMAGANIGFMFAPALHVAMRHVAHARRALGIRSVFNLVGPLSNPAGVRHQLLGVFDAHWTEPMANALKKLGGKRAWVVHGSDGLDEITTTGPTRISALENGQVKTFNIKPEDFGIPRARMSDLVGGDPAHNARAIRALLDGERGPFRDIALLNAGAAVYVAGQAPNVRAAIERCEKALDGGKAAAALAALARLSHEGQ
ncbi:MAG: anthranilate phosphoribosyltransferase [Robiginitomaculum sp.]|nr:MAG: anthranilate phosphoribosyltransferase [Robiginitomaculum sp.]